MPPSGKSEIFRRAAAAARAAREIFRGSLFCLNFMYFLRFEHDFHVQAKLYPPGMLRACSMRIRGRGARAPHHATTAPRHAHPRAQLAEYAMIPPLIILIRWHGAMHALPTGRLQAHAQARRRARRIESSRLALPCRERLSCSGGRGWDSRRRGHSRGGHCARDLIMNIMIRSPGCLAGSGGGRGAAPATAAAAMEGDSLARPGLPRGGTQKRHIIPLPRRWE